MGAAALPIIAGIQLGSQLLGMAEQRKANEANQRASEEQLAQQQRSYEAQKQQYAVQKQQADVTNIRNMRQSIRASRLAASTMVNAAGNKGGLGGSGLEGGISSLAAQGAGNLNSMMNIAQTNTAVGNIQQTNAAAGIQSAQVQGALFASANQSAQNAQGWGMVSSVAGTVFDASGGKAKIANWVNG